MSQELTLSQQLARVAADTRFADLPAPVVAAVRQRILDTLGICVAASSLDSSRAVADYVVGQGGAAHASVVGRDCQVPAAQAAFANGVLAHSLDYDDTHLPSILHPSASVVPAALAVAEREGASGADVIAAVTVGLEVCVRTGMAGYDPQTRNSLFFDRGQHATSICGALGAAAAVSHLLGRDEHDIANAVAVAASMASGIIEANRTGGSVKRIHCGWAAHAAVTAADLVAAGITGPPTVFEGRFGFYRSFLDGNYFPAAITEGLGESWVAPRIHVKPYPANHFTHTAVDAARELRERGVDADDVERLELEVATATVRTIGEPIEVKRRPQNGYQAQFSGPYVLIAALLGGGGLGVSMEDFDDALVRDPYRRSLMDRVTVRGSEICDRVYPEEFPGVVTAHLKSGRVERVEAMANRGGPDNPLAEAELLTKFRQNAELQLPLLEVEEIESRLLRLEAQPELSQLMKQLRGQVVSPVTVGRP